ncbi:MAG: cation-transporting P-type ATPase, partial [Candidatus ainarchaeum sp.]|nr:cation-transporting P-type ATPase [Candidatus ainarchaeum sp.]
TGTVTKGKMTVNKIFSDGNLIDVGGAGYEATGDFLCDGKKINVSKSPNLKLLFKTAIICNDSKIERMGVDREYSIMGLPTESALLIMAAKANLFREDLKFIRLEEIPFSSERKLMSVLSVEDNVNYVYVKGAPDILLKKCKFVYKNKKLIKLTEHERQKILDINKKLTLESYRSLALAYKQTKSSDKNCFENDLIFLGIVGLEDPPRDGIKETLALCKTAGIKVKMITGDDRNTALAIANQIGLEGGILVGEEIDKLTDDEFLNVVKEIVIFARVKPEHKLRIVKALKQNGEIVTMTGDGVNDAPALKEAHIGVAMGKNGTDVSREAADLTLKDDNFSTIVSAISEGRTVFNNIRKFLTYQLSCNYAELMIIFIAIVIGLPLPLLALQILFMNLVTDDLPAITLGLNPQSKDVMKVKPRQKANLLNKRLLILLIIAGTVMAAVTLGTFYFVLEILNEELIVARTVALVTLIFLEIANAFNFRSFRSGVHELPLFANKYLIYASILSIFATVLVVYTPLNKIFETAPLSITYWLFALVISFIIIFVFDVWKRIVRRKGGLLPD